MAEAGLCLNLEGLFQEVNLALQLRDATEIPLRHMVDGIELRVVGRPLPFKLGDSQTQLPQLQPNVDLSCRLARNCGRKGGDCTYLWISGNRGRCP